MNQVKDFFLRLFDTTDWLTYWQSDNWTQFHGWFHIISNLLLGAAYLAMLMVSIKYISFKKKIRHFKLYLLFPAFLLVCALNHILNAVVFWIPFYRLSTLFSFVAALIGCVIVLYLVKHFVDIFSSKKHTAFFAEIDQQKNIESTLKHSKNEFELLINGVKDYSIFMLDKDGKVANWSRGASINTGYSAEEILGKSIDIFYTEEEVLRGEPQKYLQLAIKQKRFETEGWQVKKDKTIFWANIVISPLYDNDNNFYGYAKVTRDITEKRKAKEQIAFLASIANNIQEPIITVDKNCIITQWNNAAEKLLIWKAEEVIGKAASEVLGAVYDNKTKDEVMISLSDKGLWRGEVVLYTKNGKALNVLMTLSFILDDENNKIGKLALIKDITERKKAEQNLNNLNEELEQQILERAEKLVSSETRFKMLIENSADGIDLSDENSNSLYRSPGAIKITGILPNQNQMSLTHPDDLDAIVKVQQEVYKTPGIPIPFQARIRHALGHYIWLEGTITNLYHVEGIRAFITNFRDVTERKELEVLLHKANTLARIGGWEVDLVKSKVFWSDITREIHETEIDYEPDLNTGINFYKEGANRDLINKILQEALDFGTSWDVELQIITAKNNERWIRVIGETEFTDGKCSRIYGSFQDIQERKMAEEKIRNMNIELEEKVHLRTEQLKKTNEEMEAFSYSISHDLRAPLRGIIGFTNILEEDYTNKLDEEARRITKVIKNNTIKMGNLIDDLLSFARLGRQPISKTSINTNSIIKDVIAEIIPKNNTVPITWIIPSFPIFCADTNTIKQVWMNLISNAIKYSNKNNEPKIEIGFTIEKDETVFFVKDNGVGFDVKYKDKLFKVFQRLHSAAEFEGTGVGLAIVEKIITKHGGNVWAEAEVGKGACFYFSLPNE